MKKNKKKIILQKLPKQKKVLKNKVILDKFTKTTIEVMSSFLENQQCQDENVQEIIFEVAKRIPKQLASINFVGIQPMEKPVSKGYHLKLVKELIKNTESNIESISLEIKDTTIEAGSRKLATTVTKEDFQDAGQDKNGLKKLYKLIAKDIAKEIHNQIRNELSMMAKKETIDLSKSEDVMALRVKLNMFSNNIARETRRGSASFAMVSKDIARMLPNEQGFTKKPEYKNQKYKYVDYIGHLDTTAFYYDEGLAPNKILLGYKGATELDTAYIYAPYTILMSGGWVVNPTTFQRLLVFMTRYGRFADLNETSVTTTSADKLATTTVTTGRLSDYYCEVTLENFSKFKCLNPTWPLKAHSDQ